MDRFTCLSCRKVSRVRNVVMNAGSSYLTCEWCHAENAYRVPVTPARGAEPPDIEITGVRRALRQRSDGTIESAPE